MRKDQIKTIIKKYKNLSKATYSDEKKYQYVRFAEYLNEHNSDFKDDSYKTEEELINAFNKAESEFDYHWNEMLSIGDDENSARNFVKDEIFHVIKKKARNQMEEVGIQAVVQQMLHSRFETVENIFVFIHELFDTDYSLKSIFVPFTLRVVLDNFMNDFKKDLDNYQLFFIPYDTLSTQGWMELYLKCNIKDDNIAKSGDIVLNIIFNHSENQILIPTILFTGIFRLFYEGMREKVLSLIFHVCDLAEYRLFLVDMVESVHEKFIDRGATYIDYETVEITKYTNLE